MTEKSEYKELESEYNKYATLTRITLSKVIQPEYVTSFGKEVHPDGLAVIDKLKDTKSYRLVFLDDGSLSFVDTNKINKVGHEWIIDAATVDGKVQAINVEIEVKLDAQKYGLVIANEDGISIDSKCIKSHVIFSNLQRMHKFVEELESGSVDCIEATAKILKKYFVSDCSDIWLVPLWNIGEEILEAMGIEEDPAQERNHD